MSAKKVSAHSVMLFVTLVLCTLCCGGVFDGALSFGVFVGALYSANPFLSALLYLATSFAFGLHSLIQAAVRAGVMLLFVSIHKLAKRKIRKWHLLLYLIAANVFYCVYQTDGYFQLFDKILFSACGIAFAFASLYVFRAVFVRGLAYRPALDETICICLFAVGVSFGASELSVWGMQVVYFFIPFALLFCSSVLGDKATLICAVLLGCGNLLSSGQYDACVFCVFCAVAIVAASRLNRFVAGLSVVLVDVVMSYFFNLHGSFSTLVFVPTLCSVVVFCVVPGSVYNYLKDCVCGFGEKYLGKSVVKKITLHTARKLYRLSDIFLSMKNAFFTMSVGAVSSDEAQRAIVKHCSETVCRDCPELIRCWRRELAQTEQNLLQISQCAVMRGKCSILDVPQNLSLKCGRVSTLLAEINVQCAAYRKYADRVEQVNNGKLLLGEQLGGVSHLLTQLAADCKGNVTYNSSKEQELVERLVFHNILCCGAVVMEQSQSLSVIVTVATKDYSAAEIEQIASKLLARRLSVERTEPTDSPSWLNVVLSPKPRFSLTFGVSSAAKYGSEASGDTHSIVQTDNGKCIIALCDGMGSGTAAEQMSATAIGLVENFYRAGFDSDTILSCVNHLLVGSGNEVFCALDICVADLNNGLVDFIKLGAPSGYVKCSGKVQILNGSSLPLGVLDEMTPSITKKALSANDTALLVSDGIADCFNDPDLLAGIFSDCTLTSPQSIAEAVLSKALKACSNKPKDDMTVISLKLA